ncbi:uncharacterized protein LOC143302120 [Babylonia areolata]|uniref:uncharacterized protein LOC143302120 n=1 Tax=Babylonia areolata TaxID=304850 RepID=UPI003FD0CF66
MESKQKKYIIGVTVALSVIAVALLVAAFATNTWVSSAPKQDVNSTAAKNRTDSMVFTGKSDFGIFKGEQTLNYVAGSRSAELTVICEPADGLCLYVFMRPGVVARTKLTQIITAYKESNGTDSSGYTQYGLFSFWLWASTIMFLALSIVMGLVNIGFSIFNIFGRPIETITGPMGLYVWNGIAFVFVVVTLAVFGTLYVTQLSKNFMMLDDYKIGWRSEGHTKLHFSFMYIIGAGAAFILNVVLLCLSGQSMRCGYSSAGEKEVDNGMILY